MLKKYPILLLILCLLLPLSVGFIAGMATSASIDDWYAGLRKPSFNPPNSIFGPVWTMLYVLMGYSLFLILTKGSAAMRNRNRLVFIIQLALNFLWSFLFFYFEEPLLALIDIVLLWLAIAWMTRTFYTQYRPAGLVNIPYLLWVSFATVLNSAIVYLN